MCDPIWQVTPRSSRTSSRRGLYSAFNLQYESKKYHLRFSDTFTKTVANFLHRFLNNCYPFLSTLDYNFCPVVCSFDEVNKKACWKQWVLRRRRKVWLEEESRTPDGSEFHARSGGYNTKTTGAKGSGNTTVQGETEKSSPLRFSGIFSQAVGNFLAQILRAYYTFLSTVDYKLLFNYNSNFDEVMPY